MHSVNVIPSILGKKKKKKINKPLSCNLKCKKQTASHLSTHFLNKNGLLVLTGAGGIINNACHDMIGYGLSKVAVHSLAASMVRKISCF